MKCVDELDESKRCVNCKEKHFFYNLTDYANWAFSQKHTIHIAHNLKGYDGPLLTAHILDNRLPSEALPKIISTGLKLITINWRTIKIIDSLSFIPMALASFAKTFDIKEFKKGFFPHKANTIENQNYIGPYFEESYYQPEMFSGSKKKEFEEWYQQNSNKKFNFKQEFFDYCWSDVGLLTEGCLNFRHIAMSNSKKSKYDKGICPFLSSCTIASFCNKLFRNNFMGSQQIAVIPSNGYNPKQKVSKKAMLWLRFISERDQIYIQHAKNDGELKCGKYQLDGVCEATKTIYEFNGCTWHGCLYCYTSSTFNSIKQTTMGSINYRHIKRIEYIKQHMPGYNIVELWEHDWHKMIKSCNQLINFLKANEEYMTQDLKPRNALYGGRTNATKLYYKCQVNEYIDYIDVNSLYPSSQLFEEYPVGHPTIIRDNFSLQHRHYFGIMKCTLIPPQKLYIPVLPARINNKLVFPLCNKCAQQSNQTTICFHNEEERKITGEWISCEVYKAMEMGYKLLQIQEVWHWNTTEKYDPISKIGGIFRAYVNMALKLKMESSGVPIDCITEDDITRFINAVRENKGIEIDRNLLKKNSGRRLIAKLIANSQWGYLAMNTNKTQTIFVSSHNEWNKMLCNDQYVIHNADLISTDKEILQVQFTIAEEFADNDSNTNVALAAFVTCHARLKLYSELEKLDDRVLYFDTDSIIYLTKPDDSYHPIIGDSLGDWTREIPPEEGKYITEFVSAGPKNYAYKLDSGITHCTVKGFNLNYLASLKITFDSIKNIVTNDQEETIKVKQLQFRTNKTDWSVKASIVDKIYGFVYDKRILLENFDTLPYGYQL